MVASHLLSLHPTIHSHVHLVHKVRHIKEASIIDALRSSSRMANVITCFFTSSKLNTLAVRLLSFDGIDGGVNDVVGDIRLDVLLNDDDDDNGDPATKIGVSGSDATVVGLVIIDDDDDDCGLCDGEIDDNDERVNVRDRFNVTSSNVPFNNASRFAVRQFLPLLHHYSISHHIIHMKVSLVAYNISDTIVMVRWVHLEVFLMQRARTNTKSLTPIPNVVNTERRMILLISSNCVTV
jgi:hypothetical protein